MRVWRRKTRSAVLDVADNASSEVVIEGAHLPVATERLERAVMVMAVHAQQLTDRLERVERELASREIDLGLVQRVDEMSATMVTRNELAEVQVRTARLAGELARVAADLRSEIGRLHDTLPTGSRRRSLEIDLERLTVDLEGLSALTDDALPHAYFDRRS